MAARSSLLNGPDHQRKFIMAIVVMVVLAAVLLLGSRLIGGQPLGEQLNRIAASQQEVLRINDLTLDLRPDLATRQVQANVAALIASDATMLETHRQKLDGKRVPKEIIEAAKNASAEDELSAAASRGELSQTYAGMLLGELNELRALLETAKGQTDRADLKADLEVALGHTGALIAQVTELQ